MTDEIVCLPLGITTPIGSIADQEPDTDQKGRMGEELVRSAFTLHGYRVIPTGIEHTPVVAANDKWVRKNLLFNILRHAPDFLVTKEVANETKYAFLEVKYWPSATRLETLDDRFDKMLVNNYLGYPMKIEEVTKNIKKDADKHPEFFSETKQPGHQLLKKHRTHQKGVHVFSDTIMVVITKEDVALIKLGDVFFAGTRSKPSGIHIDWKTKRDLALNDKRYDFLRMDWVNIKNMILACLSNYCG